MHPKTYDTSIQKSATFRRVIQWVSSGKPVDLTGWSARMELRDPFGVLIYALTTSDGSIKLGPNGYITLEILGVVTDTFTVQDASYDLFLINPETPGDTIKFLKGLCPIESTVTIISF